MQCDNQTERETNKHTDRPPASQPASQPHRARSIVICFTALFSDRDDLAAAGDRRVRVQYISR
jgi:hypothetical protein